MDPRKSRFVPIGGWNLAAISWISTRRSASVAASRVPAISSHSSTEIIASNALAQSPPTVQACSCTPFSRTNRVASGLVEDKLVYSTSGQLRVLAAAKSCSKPRAYRSPLIRAGIGLRFQLFRRHAWAREGPQRDASFLPDFHFLGSKHPESGAQPGGETVQARSTRLPQNSSWPSAPHQLGARSYNSGRFMKLGVSAPHFSTGFCTIL
jgi:hypothetical protein